MRDSWLFQEIFFLKHGFIKVIFSNFQTYPNLEATSVEQSEGIEGVKLFECSKNSLESSWNEVRTTIDLISNMELSPRMNNRFFCTPEVLCVIDQESWVNDPRFNKNIQNLTFFDHSKEFGQFIFNFRPDKYKQNRRMDCG